MDRIFIEAYPPSQFLEFSKATIWGFTQTFNKGLISKEQISYANVVSGTYSGLLNFSFNGSDVFFENAKLHTLSYVVKIKSN